MLTEFERVEALIVNLSSWEWSVEGKFVIDQQTEEALVREYRKLKEKADAT